ncbi:DUF1800 domain-containing protein [Parachitinimonas caeni]|uniref:DUF1800 domain-containing protein n=1 Tax=Parachitinimonas caeni TaxID=3031301 RepID=A0ABT7DRP0_9NEIS|nr:DUF1800 domain-containing protein [Parachitinimonas caeni]MDK2122728.1 DUF1800 domain-containing protein [Parachitinimonas caeni]
MKLRKLWITTLLALAATSAQAAGKADQFSVIGNATDNPSNLALTATLNPAPADLGANGSVWVGALFGNQVFMLTPQGWVVPASGPLPAFSNGPIQQQTVPILNGINVSGLECAQVLVGYGRDQADLFGSGTYGAVYQVPAKAQRTTPLPCSTMADADIARFLEQATFGPNPTQIAEVKRIGIKAWLEQQFALPASTLGDYPYYPTSAPTDCNSICQRDNYSTFQLQLRFFQNAMTAQDQLRQRVAFALSQILVVSGATINQAYAMAPYQNMLINNSFGNFRTILKEMTLSPAMGRYLDMVNNGKPTNASQQANENYARELLQLFSVGLWKLNPDGTVQTDAAGKPVPTYDEAVIKGFALTLTGWTFPTQAGQTRKTYNPTYYIGPMEVVATNHDTTAKTLLDGVTLPAGQTPDADLEAALDNVFNHPNVGPFIGQQLIQHLVTSNPSPGYVSRVSAVFNNNGAGVRGDLKAVVKAILLDPEARGGMNTDPGFGHLKEPVLFTTHFLRALGGISDGVSLRTQTSVMGQNVLNSPTVFNFYPPDYVLPNGQLGPEYAILNTSTALARANFVYNMVYGGGAKPDTSVTGAVGTTLDLTSLSTLAGDPAALVDRLSILLLHGTMSTDMRNQLITAVNGVAASDAIGRTRLAVYLVSTSTQFQVRR